MKSNQEKNFSLKTILKGFLNNLNIQRGFIRTLLDLITRPNHVFKYYIENNRGKYFSPARYFITIISLFGIIKILFPTYLDSEFFSLSNLEYLEGKLKIVIQFLNKTPLLYLFLFILPFSIMSRIVFYDSNKNFAMHLVANIYISSSIVIIIMFIDSVFTILSPATLEGLFGVIIIILAFVYYIYCYTKFLGVHPLYGLLKIGITLFFTIASLVIIQTEFIDFFSERGYRISCQGKILFCIFILLLLIDWGINKYIKHKKSG